MCRAFSGLLTPEAKVFWKFGVDSHSELVTLAGFKDDTADPAAMAFARFEITPTNDSYLDPDGWQYKIDERIIPAWCGRKHEAAAFAAHKQWLRKLNKILVRKSVIHPFQLKPPAKITAKHISYLRQWASVWPSVWPSVGDSVGPSVWASVWPSVWASVWPGVWASVWPSVGPSVWNSAGWASAGDSVWASVGAYIGSFFVLPEWKYINHKRGEYPFAPAVKLWECGLVPSFDGTTWRLHGAPNGKILFSIAAEELRKKSE